MTSNFHFVAFFYGHMLYQVSPPFISQPRASSCVSNRSVHTLKLLCFCLSMTSLRQFWHHIAVSVKIVRTVQVVCYRFHGQSPICTHNLTNFGDVFVSSPDPFFNIRLFPHLRKPFKLAHRCFLHGILAALTFRLPLRLLLSFIRNLVVVLIRAQTFS